MKRLPRVRRDKERLAVLYLDLDRFKTVNDTLGHPTGDLLLKAAADFDGRRIYRFFEPGMDACLRIRRALELDLRNAVAASEFEVYYQPLVTPGLISGFEALLRWHHPVRGIMARPISFRSPRKSA